MFLAHAPISYLANETIQKERISRLKNSQQVFVAVLSLIFGILIDFDFFLLMILDIPTYTHHDFFTHTPIYWMGVWLVLLLISKLIYPLLKKKTKHFLTEDLLKVLLNAFLIAGLSHMLADLLVGNIMLLYPFTDRAFTVFRYFFEPSYFTGYFASVYFAIEIITISIFFIHLSRKFLRKQKWDDIFAYILIILSTLYLGFSIFMNLQTYNKSFLEESNKPYMDYDMDFDTVRDVEDWDVDNDGIDNIEDVDYEQVVQNTKDIIQTHKLVVGESKDIWDRILLRYGALSSYRLVSQAFYEAQSPIEPVLKNFYINTLDHKGYTVEFDHVEVLKEYFERNDMLIDLNLDGDPLLPEGKIFFLVDSDGRIMNMGITLSENSLGIVLPGEKYIQEHTLDGVLMFYQDSIATFQILQ